MNFNNVFQIFWMTFVLIQRRIPNMIDMYLKNRITTVVRTLFYHTNMLSRKILSVMFVVTITAVLLISLFLYLRFGHSNLENSFTEWLTMVRLDVKPIYVASPSGVPSGLINRINITVSVPALELTFPVNQPENGNLRLILVIINRKIDVRKFLTVGFL